MYKVTFFHLKFGDVPLDLDWWAV